MIKKYVFIDCDGTIVNYHDRFYIIYCIACCKSGIIPKNRIDWLKCRMDGLPAYTQEEHEKIQPIFDELFETEDYLCFDKLIHGMEKVVTELQKQYKVYIVSFRSHDINLKNQLQNYGILNIDTIIQGFSTTTLPDEKANMICKVVPNPSGWILGDTHYEILAGQKLGLKTIACTWGDKSKGTLESYKPDFIVDLPKEILDIIK